MNQTHKPNLKMSMSGISGGAMNSSQLHFFDQSMMDQCVSFIKQYNSGEMIEEMYAPNKKNQAKKTLCDKIYDSIKGKVNQIVIAELKKKQKEIQQTNKNVWQKVTHGLGQGASANNESRKVLKRIREAKESAAI